MIVSHLASNHRSLARSPRLASSLTRYHREHYMKDAFWNWNQTKRKSRLIANTLESSRSLIPKETIDQRLDALAIIIRINPTEESITVHDEFVSCREPMVPPDLYIRQPFVSRCQYLETTKSTACLLESINPYVLPSSALIDSLSYHIVSVSCVSRNQLTTDSKECLDQTRLDQARLGVFLTLDHPRLQIIHIISNKCGDLNLIVRGLALIIGHPE